MMTHHHLRFHCSYGFESDAYDDEDRRTAHCDLQTADRTEDYREDSDDTEEDSAYEGDLSEYPAEVVAGRLTGSYTGHAAVRLSEVVGDLYGVILHRNIEVVKSDDQEEIQSCIERMSIAEPAHQSRIEACIAFGLADKDLECGRQ